MPLLSANHDPARPVCILSCKGQRGSTLFTQVSIFMFPCTVLNLNFPVHFAGCLIMCLLIIVRNMQLNLVIPLFHTGHESPELPRIDFLLIRGDS